jgi:hypothetical protein
VRGSDRATARTSAAVIMPKRYSVSRLAHYYVD